MPRAKEPLLVCEEGLQAGSSPPPPPPFHTSGRCRVIPPLPPAPAAAPAAPAAAPADIATPLSDEDMNAKLVAEFQRLGNREGIDAVMKEQVIPGVSGLTAYQQSTLLTAVAALQ